MSLCGKILIVNKSLEIFSGSAINLIIEIENPGKVFIKEIFLNFNGAINVKWDDLVNKNKDGEIVYIMQVFEDQQLLVHKHVTVQSMDVINQGKYQYNVILNIPKTLPESVNRKYGSVKYELELGVNYIAETEILFKTPLYVKRYLNICLHTEYMRPFHTVFKRYFCWGICTPQPVKFILTLPNVCFIPGDSINYFIKIENFRKLLDVQRLAIILTQTQHYKVLRPKTRTKQVHTTMNQIMHRFNENHHNSKLQGSFILPKDLTPSSPSTCLINTSYSLHFILVFTGPQTDGYISVPLIIGSHRDESYKIGDHSKYETVLQIDHDKQTDYEV